MEMTKEDLKLKIEARIDEKAEQIIEIGDDIFAHPELGYKEHRTSDIVARTLAGLGFSVKRNLGITGVAAVMRGKEPGPNICIMGELDAVVCPGHPHADSATGAAHACGHNGQVAGMLGAAMGLVLSGASEHLAGSVTFLGVPAEEFVELEYRQKLRDQGKIRFFGGKQELLANGFFDDVDISMMIHMGSFEGEHKVSVGGTSNGFVGKIVRYKGVESHAGAAPDRGVNALNAALLGLTAIHLQRETFRDEDHIRVHPIITKGGDLVNVIPADVRMETYVRGSNMEAIKDASDKVNRALRAGAIAIGAEVNVDELPGYLPRLNCEPLAQVAKANAVRLVGEAGVSDGGHGSGSSDIGDLMHVMPAIHPSCAGSKGAGHSERFAIDNQYDAYILPAKILALTAADLLWDDAKEAKRVLREFVPPYTKEQYFKNWEEILSPRAQD